MQRFFYDAVWGYKYYLLRIYKLCFGIRFGLNPKYAHYPCTFFDKIKNLKIRKIFMSWSGDIISEKEITKWYKI